jgi:hypothetical protein
MGMNSENRSPPLLNNWPEYSYLKNIALLACHKAREEINRGFTGGSFESTCCAGSHLCHALKHLLWQDPVRVWSRDIQDFGM